MEAEYISHMGNDLTVVNAARVSFDKESYEFTLRKDLDKGSDEGLVEYLAKHGHWTPFSHPQIMMRETVPIFVARQRFKHMVGFTYNEVSRRYVDDTPEFYFPTEWRLRPEGNAKQGSSAEIFTGYLTTENDSLGGYVDRGIEDVYKNFISYAEEFYSMMIAKRIAPEQARMILPQSMYTSYYVTGSLAAWARAYKQRSDSHAQKEIQDVAADWNKIIQPLFPHTWEVLTK